MLIVCIPVLLVTLLTKVSPNEIYILSQLSHTCNGIGDIYVAF